MSRFEEFIKGMEAVHGPINGVSFNSKDFPPLSSLQSPKSSSKSPIASSAVPLPSKNPIRSDAGPSSSHAVVQSIVAPPASWSSLFHSDQAAKLQFHQPCVDNGKPSVFIPKSIHKLGFSAWEDCLMGQFLGASPSFSQIQAVARQIWRCRDRVDVLNLENGLYRFKFENPNTRSCVMPHSR